MSAELTDVSADVSTSPAETSDPRTALRDIGELFTRASEDPWNVTGVNAKDFLMTLSTLFRVVARSGRMQSTGDLEQGDRDTDLPGLHPQDEPSPSGLLISPLSSNRYSPGNGAEDADEGQALLPDIYDISGDGDGIDEDGDDLEWREQIDKEHGMSLDDFRKEYCKDELALLEKNGFLSSAIHTSLGTYTWAVPLLLRTKLYSKLFLPTQDHSNQFPSSLVDDIVQGKSRIVFDVDRYIMETIKSRGDSKSPDAGGFSTPDGKIKLSQFPNGLHPQAQLPDIRWFVVDALLLIKSLKKVQVLNPHPDPFGEFDLKRQDTWKTRWAFLAGRKGEKNWAEYRLGLCDALFGIPIKTGEHYDKTPIVASTLRSVPLSVREAGSPDTPEMDYGVFDATNIQARGPFSFMPTDRLEDHLSITLDHKIKIYVHWRSLGRFRHHRVLTDRPKKFTMFDTLTSRTRHESASQSNIRPFLYTLHNYVQVSIMLFFFQNANKPASRLFFWKRRSSQDIFKKIEIEGHMKSISPPDEMRKRIRPTLNRIGGWEGMLNTDTEFRTEFAFKERLDAVYSKLREWKPSTVWEMRYIGYGGVDPVTLYAFYFSIVFGLITLGSFVVAIPQAVAAFRALP